ncbi:MAG: MFS transporter, partial [Clostridia bacterium]|nr:MFS transporter [Clostridia bacterium]
MKLNVKRTFLVGLAFLSISAFWGLYDFVVPLILKNTYALGDTWAGTVMAMDNIVALVLLPFFGAMSDRCTLRLGRRMPFILFGTVAAVILLLALPFVVR